MFRQPLIIPAIASWFSGPLSYGKKIIDTYGVDGRRVLQATGDAVGLLLQGCKLRLLVLLILEPLGHTDVIGCRRRGRTIVWFGSVQENFERCDGVELSCLLIHLPCNTWGSWCTSESGLAYTRAVLLHESRLSECRQSGLPQLAWFATRN